MTLHIAFRYNKRVFYPGEEVNGAVLVSLSAATNISSVLACFTGYAHVHRKGSDGSDKIKSEMYFDEIITLYGQTDGQNAKQYYERGNHEFPFTYVLPTSLPTSFETKKGHIRYCITALLDTPAGSNQLTAFFTVNAVVDLNTVAKSKLPITDWAHIQKKCSFCTGVNNLTAVLSISRRGYVPGECILINAEINNANNSPVSYVKATLMQVVQFTERGIPTKFKRPVVEAVRGAIMPQQSQIWRDAPLQIPPIVPSNMTGCSLIGVRYSLYLYIGSPSSSSQETQKLLKVPIIIGNIPLLHFKHMFETGTGDAPEPQMPQPNFEPCQFGPHYISEMCDKSSSSNIPFSPLYATYTLADVNNVCPDKPPRRSLRT